MENSAVDKEVLVLTDDTGAYYAIPVETLGRYRVTDEQKAEIDTLLGADVSGYGMFEQYLMEQRAGQYQADRQDEAGRERILKSSRESADDQAKSPAGRGFFTGVIATLQSLSRSTPEEA